ncbi:MAG: chorismate mutase [Treponema sp.]|nr:chorismate mutase [Treponema sp.]
MGEKRLNALRGATRCTNDKDDIQKQTVALYDELLARNSLTEDDLVSVIFSVTRDLDAKNPASALRSEGRAMEAALFVTQEAYFPGGLERVIRLLVHCYLEPSRKPIHVYRNGAEVLRPDRAK